MNDLDFTPFDCDIDQIETSSATYTSLKNEVQKLTIKLKNEKETNKQLLDTIEDLKANFNML